MTLYVPSHFHVEERARLVDFMREHAFATLVSGGEAGLHVSHVPLLVDVDGDTIRLRGHVARAKHGCQRQCSQLQPDALRLPKSATQYPAQA